MSHLSTVGDTRIDRAAFAEQLSEATERTVTFAATMVRQRMPASRRYLIVPQAASYPPGTRSRATSKSIPRTCSSPVRRSAR